MRRKTRAKPTRARNALVRFAALLGDIHTAAKGDRPNKRVNGLARAHGRGRASSGTQGIYAGSLRSRAWSSDASEAEGGSVPTGKPGEL